MADDISFKMIGVEDLIAKLNAVSYDAKRKGGRFALRKAAQYVRDDAKRRAMAFDDPGTGRRIADNIAERWDGRHFKRTGDPAFRVGVRHTAKIKEKGNPDQGSGGPTPHWRLLEFGTKRMAAQPFMRPALEGNIGAVTNVFVTEYEKAIDRAIKKAKKTGTKA